MLLQSSCPSSVQSSGCSGYPGGPLYVFDPQQPWTAFKGGPPGKPAPARNAWVSNPREIGAFARCTRVTIMHSSSEGADGKLYFGNKRKLYIMAAGRKPKLLSSMRMSAPVFSTPIAANGVLYVASNRYLWAAHLTP